MDFYVVQLQDEIPLYELENVENSNPRSIRLTGRGFRRVIEVVINGESITSGWTLVSEYVLDVELPTILQTADIRSVRVYSDRVHDQEASRLVFRFGQGKRVTGLQYVIQLLVRWLFTTPGSDAWYPEAGGGWNRLYGYTDKGGNATAIVGVLVEGLNRVISFIHQIQAQYPDLPPEERLASASIESTIQTQEGFSVRMKVRTVAGNEAYFGVRL